MRIDGAKIAALLKKRNMLQKELARQAMISVYYLSKIENNEAIPRIKTIARIAKVLGVSISDLMQNDIGGGK